MRSKLSLIARIFPRVAAAVAVSAIALSGLMFFRHSSRQARLSQSAKLAQPAQVVGVATVHELTEPWSSKTFIFHKPETKEDISSIVIR